MIIQDNVNIKDRSRNKSSELQKKSFKNAAINQANKK